ncbi:MAG: NAD(+) synthase [Cyanobacteriota bacterium]|nr:NAD(+) synthase [Cyanobacteriota bacterium]MDY6358214.1 NAD(+) synthase [Cyanobacteriota bacterium]MDY6363786.1 NAD(+) synthase [Cyanobacteriota bacterium]MDY6382382.1 NAD(+) synthase [Cyanobacteriota bacterium]
MENNIEKIYKLSEEFDGIDDRSRAESIEKELKELLKPYKKGSVGLAQIDPIAGDIEYNAKKVIKYIKHSQNVGLDMVVFPELILMGYPIEDTIDRHPIIVEDNVKWLKEVAKICTDITALVGFVEPRRYDRLTGKKYYNSVAVLNNGKIQSIVRKSLLPTYSEFNDYRYIEPSPVVGAQSGETLGQFDEDKIEDCSKLNVVNGVKYGITICEDCWNDSDFFNDKTLYSVDPIEELSKEHPDVFINCSASPTRAKKEQLKHNMFSFIAKKYSTPIVYVNQVGAIDNSSFDGSSRVFDKDGKLLARAKSFREQFLIVNPLMGLGKIYPLTNGLEKTLTENKVYTLEYEPDLERTYKTVIQGIKDYFKKTGFKRAVIGLSGGLDSSVCAVLLADALGAENVFGISMPSKITSTESKSDAEVLAQNLGINFATAPISQMFETTNNCLQKLFKEVEKKWDGRYKKSFTPDNIQARSRAMFLWGISNEFGSTLPIATSDKSELYMGYATINGDMSGGFAPIADIPKTKLFALARWMNENRKVKNAMPQSIIDKKPGAELAIDPKTGKPLVAEDALMPYEFLDEVIWRIENKKEHYYDMLNSEFLYEKKHKVSQEQKIQWLDKFYKRMAAALYKWSILPPSVIVDSRSINKYDYKQPITSSRINYKGISCEEIDEKINDWQN